eukprot:Opistho-2@37007
MPPTSSRPSSPDSDLIPGLRDTTRLFRIIRKDRSAPTEVIAGLSRIKRDPLTTSSDGRNDTPPRDQLLSNTTDPPTSTRARGASSESEGAVLPDMATDPATRFKPPNTPERVSSPTCRTTTSPPTPSAATDANRENEAKDGQSISCREPFTRSSEPSPPKAVRRGFIESVTSPPTNRSLPNDPATSVTCSLSNSTRAPAVNRDENEPFTVTRAKLSLTVTDPFTVSRAGNADEMAVNPRLSVMERSIPTYDRLDRADRVPRRTLDARVRCPPTVERSSSPIRLQREGRRCNVTLPFTETSDARPTIDASDGLSVMLTLPPIDISCSRPSRVVRFWLLTTTTDPPMAKGATSVSVA